MKILVAIKRVPDQDMPIRLRADGNGIELGHARYIINPFDENALEEALRLKEQGKASEIVAVSCGVAACSDTLRSALALGADRALLVQTDAELQSLAVAKLLHAVVLKEQPQLVMCGKQATDSDAGEAGVMLAGLLGWGQATAVSTLNIEGERITATCEIEGGLETLSLQLPALLTADLRLNQPRYVSLQGSMKARKKTIETLTAEELQVDVQPRLQHLSLTAPPARKAGVRVADVSELLERLRNEAGVL